MAATVPGRIVPPPTLGPLSSTCSSWTARAAPATSSRSDSGTPDTRPHPQPEPASDVTSLSGTYGAHVDRPVHRIVRRRVACIGLVSTRKPWTRSVRAMPEPAQPGDAPSLDGWLTDSMYLLPVRSDRRRGHPIRERRRRTAASPSSSARPGPAGWPDPDVCARSLPPSGVGSPAVPRRRRERAVRGWGLGRRPEAAELPDAGRSRPRRHVLGRLPVDGPPATLRPTTSRSGSPIRDRGVPGRPRMRRRRAGSLGTDATGAIGVYFDSEVDANVVRPRGFERRPAHRSPGSRRTAGLSARPGCRRRRSRRPRSPRRRPAGRSRSAGRSRAPSASRTSAPRGSAACS